MNDGIPDGGAPEHGSAPQQGGVPEQAGNPAQGAASQGGVPAQADAPSQGGVPVQSGVPAEADAKKARKPLPQPVLATLLVAGSFGGIAAVMAGMLVVLSPSDPQESGPVPGTVTVRDAGNAAFLPPTVGPGGPGVPLTAADPTAPPPAPALQPIAPLTLTSAASSSSKPLSSSSSGAKKTTSKAAAGRPLKISIPAIGVKAAVGSVGVDKSGVIQAPPLSKPGLTGWYRYGPAPGDQGPAVILGHVNTRKGAAVFSRLRELKRGNKIAVLRADGKMAIFTVDGIEQVSKSTFPTKRVYSNTITSSLRLITCGGVYNAKQHHYTDNIIVYATLTQTK